MQLNARVLLSPVDPGPASAPSFSSLMFVFCFLSTAGGKWCFVTILKIGIDGLETDLSAQIVIQSNL